MRTLVISPHLDDAAFSCGGLIASGLLGEVRVITCLTKSVANPTGFALACQLDKGLDDKVDYMALRREEDRNAMAELGADYEHYDLTEAPHRGVDNAEQLFEDIKDIIFAQEELQPRLMASMAEFDPTLVLYPRGAGNHVDHQQVEQATTGALREYASRGIRALYYYDQPYTNKNPRHYPYLKKAPTATTIEDMLAIRGGGTYRFPLSDAALRRKLAACAAYTTQVGFQFGSEADMARVLGREEYFIG